jgi:hypothetical protein
MVACTATHISYDYLFKEKSGQILRLKTYLNLHVVHTCSKGATLTGEICFRFLNVNFLIEPYNMELR